LRKRFHRGINIFILSAVACLLAPTIGFGLDVRIFTLAHRTPDELIDAVKSLLSPEGRVSMDAQTNVIIVSDYPENIAKIETLLTTLDRPAKLVRLFITFFETALKIDADISIHWGYRDEHFMAGNLPSNFKGKGFFVEGSPEAGFSKSERTTSQNLLIRSGSPGKFVTGENIPIHDRIVVYLRSHGYVIEGISFRSAQTGFYVTPTVLGDTVHLEVRPFFSYFAGSEREEILFYEASSSLDVPFGETVVMTQSDEAKENIIADIFSGFENTKTNRYFYICITPQREQ